MTYSELLRTEMLKLRRLEEQTSDGLETFRKRAQDARLRTALGGLGTQAAFRTHRLEDLCVTLGWVSQSLPSRCVEGIQYEAREVLNSEPDGPIADALIGCLALRLVHLGIASYQAAHALALAGGDPRLVRPLARSLDEERKADQDLDWILRSAVGPAAGIDGGGSPHHNGTRR